jgi:hypothetical protein
MSALPNQLDKRKIAILFWVTSVVGLLLWVDYFSAYSFKWLVLEVVFPFIVLLLGITLYKKSKKIAREGKEKQIITFVSISSIVGGLLGSVTYALTLFIMLIPPFSPGGMFLLSELSQDRIIYSAVSPNGMQVANVHFRPTGAYSSGNGHVLVSLSPRFLPFIEKQIYDLDRVLAPENEFTITWQDTNTVYLGGENKTIQTNTSDVEMPLFVAVPVRIINLISGMISFQNEQKIQTAFVRSVPTYPEKVFRDESTFDKTRGEQRYMEISEANYVNVADWYKQNVSSSQWNIISFEKQSSEDVDLNNKPIIRNFYCGQLSHKICKKCQPLYMKIREENNVRLNEKQMTVINMSTNGEQIFDCKWKNEFELQPQSLK